MRPLEAIYVGTVLVVLAIRWVRPRTRQTTATLLGVVNLTFLLTIIIDQVRWEMFPAYALGLVAGVLLAGDLQRAAGAKAGASARFRSVRSPLARAGHAAALVISAVVVVLLPGLFLPRVSFARLGGLYDVGRIDAFWVDSSRSENLSSQPGERRGIWVSFWYPAEQPAGRRARYHPNAGALAADLARGSPFPSFTFRNLARARTRSTVSPRFSVREGRSPLLLFSHDTAGTRMEATYLFEELASHGYVVASIDHSYASSGTVLPDGRHLPARPAPADASNLLATWTQDARFVLNRMHAFPAGDVTDTLNGHLQLDHIGVMGRGLGGAVAAELTLRDDRVKAGIGLAGDYGPEQQSVGLRLPFLVFTVAADSQSAGTVADLLRHGGTETRFEAAVPANFSDLPLWSPWFARRRGLSGSDDPRDVHAAVTALVLRFMDQYLKGRTRQQSVELPGGVSVRVIPHEAR